MTARRLDPAVFAALAAAWWAAHDVGDHVVQTDAQASAKAGHDRASWYALAGHVATYTATQTLAAAALRAAGVPITPARAALGLAFSAATHAFLDRRWPVVELLDRTGSPQFARPRVRVDRSSLDDTSPHRSQSDGPLPLHGPYLADQALHHLCVLVAAALAAWRRRPAR